MATGAVVGFDARKLVKGRKRLALVDTLGNVLASRVVSTHVLATAAAIAYWDKVATTHPLPRVVQVVMGDSSLAGLFAERLAHYCGIRFKKTCI